MASSEEIWPTVFRSVITPAYFLRFLEILASEIPMAKACFLLLTLGPFLLPDLSVPDLNSCITFFILDSPLDIFFSFFLPSTASQNDFSGIAFLSLGLVRRCRLPLKNPGEERRSPGKIKETDVFN